MRPRATSNKKGRNWKKYADIIINVERGEAVDLGKKGDSSKKKPAFQRRDISMLWREMSRISSNKKEERDRRHLRSIDLAAISCEMRNNWKGGGEKEKGYQVILLWVIGTVKGRTQGGKDVSKISFLLKSPRKKEKDLGKKGRGLDEWGADFSTSGYWIHGGKGGHRPPSLDHGRRVKGGWRVLFKISKKIRLLGEDSARPSEKRQKPGDSLLISKLINMKQRKKTTVREQAKEINCLNRIQVALKLDRRREKDQTSLSNAIIPSWKFGGPRNTENRKNCSTVKVKEDKKKGTALEKQNVAFREDTFEV